MLEVRPASSDRDLHHFAQIVSSVSPDVPTSVEALRWADATYPGGKRFLAWLDAEKRKLGVVDFDDLLLRTLALLDDQAVLERARSQYDFIFVDEFQDTDRTQARIIERR